MRKIWLVMLITAGSLATPTTPARAAPATCNGLAATIVGTAGNDVITGTAGNDVIAAFGGNDTVSGLGGNDTACLGQGNDFFDGGTLNDTFVAEAGAADGTDSFVGGAGTDRVSYGARTGGVTVTLDGVANDGTLFENDNNNIDVEEVIGGAGPDKILGNAATGFVDGNAGDDIIDCSAGTRAAILVGRDGHDTITGGTQADSILGFAGNDVLTGGGGRDSIWGHAGTDRLLGGGDDDILSGGDGNDALLGNDGDDELLGDDGNDTLAGQADDDVLRGGDGDDTGIASASAVDGTDSFSGGAGVDLANYSARTDALTISLDGLADDGVPGEGDNNGADVEDAIGGSRGDVLTGNALSNHLNGNTGDDTINTVGDAAVDVAEGSFGYDTCNTDFADTELGCEV
ncbi:calcium-binding protein [Virgisporangium aurantiacum]|uniref:Hemolysin-type calcium-binding repeat-containing protein n=1 Tax=Virgisporangium aurantiacum TaxID=175570 RepID=A0A8J3Z138_9ACTN|nr:calcium-binding protein [Virgisporangium aurantiacum]GIJ55531.1 hypothetical protein Vau01_030470 [Virgisporangium aurantiacum]